MNKNIYTYLEHARLFVFWKPNTVQYNAEMKSAKTLREKILRQ